MKEKKIREPKAPTEKQLQRRALTEKRKAELETARKKSAFVDHKNPSFFFIY